MKFLRKIAVITLAMAMLVQPLSNTKSQAANDGISTQADNVAGMSITLDIDTDGATRCIAYIIGEPGTSRIAGTMKLKKVTSSGTTTVKSWDISRTGDELKVSKTCYILSKGTYRLEIKVKVTRNGYTETVSGSRTSTY